MYATETMDRPVILTTVVGECGFKELVTFERDSTPMIKKNVTYSRGAGGCRGIDFENRGVQKKTPPTGTLLRDKHNTYIYTVLRCRVRTPTTHHASDARLQVSLDFALTASDLSQGERQSRDTRSCSRTPSEAARVGCYPRPQKLSAEPRPPPL